MLKILVYRGKLILLSDLFSELENNLGFDIIISNPPYIAEFMNI